MWQVLVHVQWRSVYGFSDALGAPAALTGLAKEVSQVLSVVRNGDSLPTASNFTAEISADGLRRYSSQSNAHSIQPGKKEFQRTLVPIDCCFGQAAFVAKKRKEVGEELSIRKVFLFLFESPEESQPTLRHKNETQYDGPGLAPAL